ncbi:MAG: TylF/MycF/NovP-related O-methyltransferase, partial [Dehalococcoidia bacterium]
DPTHIPPPALAAARHRRRRALTDERRLARRGRTADRRILEQALPYSMTSVARMQALVDAVRYCVRRDVPGGFAECGVWRGGSVLAMILTRQELGVSDRDVYLFDTFEGSMSLVSIKV